MKGVDTSDLVLAGYKVKNALSLGHFLLKRLTEIRARAILLTEKKGSLIKHELPLPSFARPISTRWLDTCRLPWFTRHSACKIKALRLF